MSPAERAAFVVWLAVIAVLASTALDVVLDIRAGRRGASGSGPYDGPGSDDRERAAKPARGPLRPKGGRS